MRLGHMTLTSPDFTHGGRLDNRFGAAYDNQAPVLRIAGVPKTATELALIVHDPDAPLPEGYTHWVVYGIPPETTTLDGSASEMFRAGLNDAGTSAYYGPKPPAGHGLHHYYFTLYALDTRVEGAPSRAEFLSRYDANILEIARIVGVFSTEN